MSVHDVIRPATFDAQCELRDWRWGVSDHVWSCCVVLHIRSPWLTGYTANYLRVTRTFLYLPRRRYI